MDYVPMWAEDWFNEGFNGGFEIGMKEGAERASVRVAKSMLTEGMPLESIKKFTYLSIAKIKKLGRSTPKL